MLSGKCTSLCDFPFIGKFMSLVTKCDVAPESITNFVAPCLSIRHVHMFDSVFVIGWIVVILSISLTYYSLSVSWSGAQ